MSSTMGASVSAVLRLSAPTARDITLAALEEFCDLARAKGINPGTKVRVFDGGLTSMWRMEVPMPTHRPAAGRGGESDA